MMLLIFYKMPSGLNLYIMSSSLFGIIEQHRIRKHIKQREAAGTLHKEPAKAKPDTPQRKRSGELNFFQKLQKMAEDAKKQQAQRKPRNKVRR
jgi:membrane protein insertase Oxa1/YidC/SpoIIIJ